MKKVLFFVLIFLCINLKVNAQTFEFDINENENLFGQIHNEFSVGDVNDCLPEDVSDLIDSLQIDTSNPLSLNNIFSADGFENLKTYFLNKINLPLKSISVLLTTILVCAFCSSFATKNTHTKSTLNFLCVSSVVLVFISQITSLIATSTEVLGVLNVLIVAFIPIFAGILIAALRSGVSATFSSTMFFLCEIISYALNKIVIPFSNMFIAMSVASGISENSKISGIVRLIKKCCYIILSFAMVLFLSVLSVQTTLANATDNAMTKTVKFFMSSFIPIIGPSLSETLGSFRSCIALLKSTLGIYIVIVIVLIVLPKIFEIIMFKLVFTVCGDISDLFEVFPLKAILDAFNQALSLTLCVVLCVSLMFVFSITVISIASGSL